MKRLLAGCVLCALCAACLAGCDMAPEEASCCGGENRDLSGYEDDARAVIEHTFSGTIEDGDMEVPCRFDGQPFALDVQAASPMICNDTGWHPADCTHASYAQLELEGELVADAVYQVTGHASMFNGSELSVIMITDLPCYGNNLGDGMLDNLTFESEIGQINWSIQPDEANTSEWELCMLNVEAIE